MNKADKKAFEEYKEDMRQEALMAEWEVREQQRREWAQLNGNDSGFDPYWDV